MTETLADVRKQIDASARPLLCSHIRLDGDAVGSEVALLHILRGLGKNPHAVNDGAIPRAFRFLAGIESLGTSPAHLRDDYDLAVVLDSASWGRLPRIRERLPDTLQTVFIDHHPGDGPRGHVNWVAPSASSVGEMIFLLASDSGWAVPAEAATALYLALVSDTGRFAFANTSPTCRRTAAALIELGADRRQVVQHLYYAEPAASARLRGEVLQGLHIHDQGTVAVARLTADMMNRHDIDAMDTQEYSELPRSVAGVKVAVLLRETDGGQIKASLRSEQYIDLAAIAAAFGGGGHHDAAGCELDAPIDEAERRIVDQIRRAVVDLGAPEPRKEKNR